MISNQVQHLTYVVSIWCGEVINLLGTYLDIVPDRTQINQLAFSTHSEDLDTLVFSLSQTMMTIVYWFIFPEEGMGRICLRLHFVEFLFSSILNFSIILSDDEYPDFHLF